MFGRELPKAWGVLEGGGGDDVRFSKSRAFAASRSRVSSSSFLSSPSLAAVVAKKVEKQDAGERESRREGGRRCR